MSAKKAKWEKSDCLGAVNRGIWWNFICISSNRVFLILQSLPACAPVVSETIFIAWFFVAKQKRLTDALAEPVESLFEAVENDAWASIRKLFNRETGTAMSSFSDALSGFELGQEVMENMVKDLKEFAAGIVEKKAREEAGKVLIRMKDR